MKNLLNKIHTWMLYFQNIKVLYQKIWIIHKPYLFLSAFMIIIYVIKPFNSIIFIRLILEEVIGGQDIYILAIYVIAMCVIGFLLKVSLSLFEKYENKCIEEIKGSFLLEIEDITMTLPYETLENPEFIRNRQKAMEIFYPTQSRYMDIHNTILMSKSIFVNLFQIIGLIAILSSLNFLIIIAMLVVCIISIIIESLAAEREFHLWNITLVNYARRLGYLQDVSTNIAYAKEVRLNNLSNWIVNKIDSAGKMMIRDEQKIVFKFALTALIPNGLLVLLNCSIYVVFFWLAYNNRITVADVTVYFNTVAAFFAALVALSNCIMVLYKSGMFLGSYLEYIGTIKECEKETDFSYMEIPGLPSVNLEFKDVWFQYPLKEEYTLKNINLKIVDRTKTAIVGDNGAGKTTLIKLILRLYKPTKGTIYLNGVDINTIPKDIYNNIISVVFQDFMITNFSLYENIIFNEELNVEKVDKIIEELQLRNMIEKLPHGYDTVLGKMFDKDGIELSGGQAQKVAIARALYKKSELVILDEPTAMLSPTAENEIYQNFSNLTNNKTTIYISHRMSSCQFCDSILVLEQGEIVEVGYHKELMERKGLYYKLFSIQAEFYQDMKEVPVN